MVIDHIFIFSDDQGKVADDLVAFGLREGSSRVHVGQGTSNRKFYFNNFFLEILWVHNGAELHSKQTKTSGLWQRADYKQSKASPFGLCLVNAVETEQLFENAFTYQPDYFPKGMAIDILRNDVHPDLPWTFQLPMKGQQKHPDEPTDHPNGLRVLTEAIFEYQEATNQAYIDHFKENGPVTLKQSSRNWLTLVFDDHVQGKMHDFETLCLTIKY